MTLAVTPRTGKVGGEFPDECVGSPSTLVSTLWGICARMLSTETVSDMVDV